MEEQIVIDEQEVVNFILDQASQQGFTLKEEDVFKVLELEFEFLKLKGVVEE
jgi:hypothetical protein